MSVNIKTADGLQQIAGNAQGGGGSANIEEITKAEYDAKGESVLTDNIAYFVKDYSEESGCVYDDTERVIGTWFGKPLYRKVITNTIGNDSNLKSIYNTTGLRIVNISGYLNYVAGNQFLNIPWSNNVRYIDCRSLNNSLSIGTNETAFYGSTVQVIITYTKVGE